MIAPLTQLHWRRASAPPTLTDTGLHLWRMLLTEGEVCGDADDLALLSAQQVERMQRLRQPAHQCRYLRTQARCRRILGRYVEIAPDALSFHHGPAGKPMLDCDGAPPEFNLSTTGDLAVLAVSATRQIGIDCELEREHNDIIGIGRRMFDEDCVAALSALTGTARVRAFHLHWTTLEARVKADGRGLARHRDADLPGLMVAHALAGEIAGRIAVLAVARQGLPPPDQWLAFEFDR